ncbi:DinB family protein [Arthrobacter jiangjiafuii]|uniref:DinB family protein n=1 Tax=Arthrobacter jiangjiafuii TaxID=2817475 RepID=UPI003080062C
MEQHEGPQHAAPQHGGTQAGSDGAGYAGTLDLGGELADQLRWHWENQARPRLEGLTDEEYFWEPVADCWSVRPRGTGSAPVQAGHGDFTIDFGFPEPVPPPVTTIAWRIGHLLVGVLGVRNAAHFGGPPVNYEDFAYPGTAAEALGLLDEYYAIGAVSAMDEAALAARWEQQSGTGPMPR